MKKVSKEIGGCIKNEASYLPINMTQISRCEKKLFFSANHDFRPQKYAGKAVHLYMLNFFEFFRFLEYMKKVFNKNW